MYKVNEARSIDKPLFVIQSYLLCIYISQPFQYCNIWFSVILVVYIYIWVKMVCLAYFIICCYFCLSLLSITTVITVLITSLSCIISIIVIILLFSLLLLLILFKLSSIWYLVWWSKHILSRGRNFSKSFIGRVLFQRFGFVALDIFSFYHFSTFTTISVLAIKRLHFCEVHLSHLHKRWWVLIVWNVSATAPRWFARDTAHFVFIYIISFMVESGHTFIIWHYISYKIWIWRRFSNVY